MVKRRINRASIVTKKSRAQSVPVEEWPKILVGALKGSGKILGDIISPIDVEWEAEGAGPREARARLDFVGQSVAGSRVKARHRKRVR